LDKKEDKLGVSLFPNPTSGLITIKNIGQEKIESIQIYDPLGKEVINIARNEQSTDIDLSYLKDGFYFARIIIKGKLFTEKIILKK